MENKYKAVEIPLNEIFADAKFNCRGPIGRIDVVHLIDSIKERGLDQPIVLKPYSDPSRPEFKYKVVAGHCRHLAFRFLNKETIPAFIRPDLDDFQAHQLNLQENLIRNQLNILQEANGLRYFLEYKKGDKLLFNEKEIADMFHQSTGWVQVRKTLLSLDPEIQHEAAAGMINQDQIKKLAQVKNRDERFALVRKIKSHKIAGQKVKLTKSAMRPSELMRARQRDRTEIREMGSMLYDVLSPCLLTRLCAWCAGDISTAAFLVDLHKECKEKGIKYELPAYVHDAILGVGNKQPVEYQVV